MQLKLPFLEHQQLTEEIWEHIANADRVVVLGKLAKLIAKTAKAEIQQGDTSHE